MADADFTTMFEVQAEVEGIHGEPHEGGQHGVVREGSHDPAAHGAVVVGDPHVGQEAQVEQEQGNHQLN